MFRIDADSPASRMLTNVNIRYDIFGVVFTDTVTRVRIGSLDQLDDFR